MYGKVEPSPEILALVKPEWQDAFRHFVETGDCTEDFKRYYDSDPKAQEATDIILEVQEKDLREKIQLVCDIINIRRKLGALVIVLVLALVAYVYM